MKDSVLISVIIPCYNQEEYLSSSLESILNQTYKNLEIIVIDDCSTDRSFDILQGYAKMDSRIRVHRNEKNLRLISTLNKGLSLATGELIARMDADDISSLDRLSKMHEFLVENLNVDIVGSYCKYIDEKGKNEMPNPNVYGVNSDTIHFVSLFESPIIHASILGRKSVFEKYRFELNERNLHIEDYELWSRMLKDGIKIRNIPEYLYYYRINRNSVSVKHRKIQFSNHINCSLSNLKYCGFFVDPSLHKHILCRHQYKREYTYLSYKKSIELLDEILKGFLKKHKYQENQEISQWVRQRKVKMWLFTLVNGNFKSKFICALYLPAILVSLFSNLGLIYTKYTLLYIKKRICSNR